MSALHESLTLPDLSTDATEPTTTTTTVEVPPPLPLEIRDRILAHLLPPSPPLPLELLSTNFLQRLTFLPPSEYDLDAHLTPFPSSSAHSPSPHPLTDALLLLAGAPHISATQYAFDGEMAIAHALLSPSSDGYDSDDGVVEINFAHQAKRQSAQPSQPSQPSQPALPQEKEWVYSGARLGSSAFDWRNDPADVNYGYGGAEAPEDYWAGFTPPSTHGELDEQAQADEDDYWAQYGAGEAHPEPSHYEEPVTPPSTTIAPDPAVTLSLLLSGLEKPGAETEQIENASTTSKSASASAASQSQSQSSVLEQKIRAKARAQLMRAWAEFSAHTDAESAAYDWLRLGREVADRPSWKANAQSMVYPETRTAVVVARLEAAKDLHDVLSGEGDAFWRLVEETIRIHTNPVVDEEQEYEQS